MHTAIDVQEREISVNLHSYNRNDAYLNATQRASQDVIEFTDALTHSQVRMPMVHTVKTL